MQCFYRFICSHDYILFLFLPIKPWVYSAFISSFAVMVIYSVVDIHYKVSISSNEIIVMQWFSLFTCSCIVSSQARADWECIYYTVNQLLDIVYDFLKTSPWLSQQQCFKYYCQPRHNHLQLCSCSCWISPARFGWGCCSSWWMRRRPIPHRQGLLKEGWGPAIAHLLVAAESCCWCTALAALWTGKGLGWGWLGDCSLLPPASFLCGFISLCLSVSNFHLTFLSGEHCGLTWGKVYIFEKVLKHEFA